MSDEYFATGDPVVSARPGAFFSLFESDGAQIAPGIRSRPVAGEGLMMTYVVWDADGIAPMHAHSEEQMVLLIEGRVELRIGDETRVLRPGDVAVIPAYASHGGRGLADRSICVEAFAPPRSLLLEMAGQPPTK